MCTSSGGTRYTRKQKFGMPKIPTHYLKSTVFLYGSRDDASAGRNIGGTGFLVGMETVLSGRFVCYVVSNWHVAVQGFPVVRIPLKAGGYDIFELDCADWVFLPKYDIAAVHLPLDEKHDFSLIPNRVFLTEDAKTRHKIGPGDDVFMVGRFVDHGDKVGIPDVRFGNVSMDPAPMQQTHGEYTDSYCIDMHSRSGFSGSPVFVYRTPGHDLGALPAKEMKDNSILMNVVNHLSLLGIHWGQFPEIWEVSTGGELIDKSSNETSLLSGGKFIRGLSGMTCVLPAWSILEVLNMPKLKSDRDELDKQLKSSNVDPVPEGVRESDEDVLRTMLSTPPKPHDADD